MNYEEMEGTPSAAVADGSGNYESPISAEDMQRLEEQMKLRQNLPVGIFASLVIGLACAALWALITLFTQYQIGYMAWGVGFAVGAIMKAAGKGLSPVYGIAAAVIALLSCLLGNFLSYIAFIARDIEMTFWDTLTGFDYNYIFALFSETFSVMDVIFYILAVSTAYSLGFIRNRKEAAV